MSAPALNLMPCLSSLLEIIALVASLVPCECHQAIISSQEDKQVIKFKAGAIKCYKEKKITSPPNEWHNIPFRVLCSGGFLTCHRKVKTVISRSNVTPLLTLLSLQNRAWLNQLIFVWHGHRSAQFVTVIGALEFA